MSFVLAPAHFDKVLLAEKFMFSELSPDYDVFTSSTIKKFKKLYKAKFPEFKRFISMKHELLKFHANNDTAEAKPDVGKKYKKLVTKHMDTLLLKYPNKATLAYFPKGFELINACTVNEKGQELPHFSPYNENNRVHSN